MYNFPIDILSKIYIIGSWSMGINRLPVAFKIKGRYKIVLLSYSLLLNCVIGYYVLGTGLNEIIAIVKVFNLIQYYTCSINAIKFCGTLQNFYNELFEFDKDIKGQRRDTLTFKNYFLLVVTFICVIITTHVLISYLIETGRNYLLVLLFLDLNNLLESLYYGHLFSLLEFRLKSIRILLLSSFPHKNQKLFLFENEHINFKDKYVVNLLNRNPDVEVKKLLLLYYKLVKAYDYFNAAIKWQLFLSLITSFANILSTIRFIMLSYAGKYGKQNFWNELPGIMLLLIRSISVLVPCQFGEKVRKEVVLLHSALLTRTHQHVFDVTSRRDANLFLELIQARTLTFSVFRMIEINTTLPVKFMGLLATYSLILMQFEKVVNFEKTDG